MSTTYAHRIRSMITLSAVASLLVVLEAGCSSSSPCALPCGAIGATFNLACNSNALTSVVASRPCSTLRFTGTFSNPAMAARFGLGIGDAFDISVAATRGGIVSLLGGLC